MLSSHAWAWRCVLILVSIGSSQAKLGSGLQAAGKNFGEHRAIDFDPPPSPGDPKLTAAGILKLDFRPGRARDGDVDAGLSGGGSTGSGRFSGRV